MTEQRIRVNQEQGERQIPVAQQASERSVCVGGEPSVLHGIDGVSPIATVTQTESGAVISITDRDGTTTAEVHNGERGERGPQGERGERGEQGAQGVPGERGATGATGATGPAGPAGSDGADGFSPIATVTKSGNTATITITDKNGTTTASVTEPTKTSDLTNDGADGASTYVEADELATVATSGSYNDLTDKPSITPELVEMSYGESNAWAKFIAAYQAHCIVYCRASSNADPSSGSQTRKAFMAYVNNATNPTQVEFQYYRSVSAHTDSQQGDQVFIYLLTNANGGTWTVTARNAFSKVVAGSNMTSSYSNGTITLNATQPTVPTKTSDLTNDGADNTSTYVEADELAAVATSGSYNDLSNRPTIPEAQVNSDWSANSGVAQILNKPTLATVATSGSYNDL